MATKRRVAVRTNPLAHNFLTAAPGVTVIEEKPGNVTRIDKAKGYYKGLIALVGSLLIAANQAAPLLPADAKGFVSGAIGFLTIAGVVLKANETWIEGL